MTFIVPTAACDMLGGMAPQSKPDKGRTRSRAWLWLLTIPVLALIFPGLYNRETPALLGFPFFYWYQLAWVFLATGVLALVYWLHRD